MDDATVPGSGLKKDRAQSARKNPGTGPGRAGRVETELVKALLTNQADDDDDDDDDDAGGGAGGGGGDGDGDDDEEEEEEEGKNDNGGRECEGDGDVDSDPKTPIHIFYIFNQACIHQKPDSPCGEGKWDEACLEALQSEAPHTGPFIRHAAFALVHSQPPTAPTSGFVTFWQRDHVIIPRYTCIPTRKWWGKLCLWVSHMSHSDLVSLTFWSSIQLGSAETCASASGQQKGSTSDVGLKVMKLGTGLCNWPV